MPMTATLAYDDHGAGVPIVLLPGLTFDRSCWRPIVDRLGSDVRTITVDLPGQGESAGPPRPLVDVAAQVHELVADLGVERPIVVGHSMSGAVAMIYAASYAVRGVVDIDNPFDVRPFAALVKRLTPALRSPAFEDVFARFQESMGLDRVPPPLRSQALASQEVRQDVVVGYWEQLLRSDPEELQAWIDELAEAIAVPVLAVFGETLPPEQRDYARRLVPGIQLEEWPGRGHFVHLAEADRFAARLREFAELCA
jgi:pimeloyl-ACP methyl ester carboxylesterase